jgi:hypothetical protein
MMDEEKYEKSPTISPFLFDNNSSEVMEISYLCLDDPKVEEEEE